MRALRLLAVSAIVALLATASAGSGGLVFPQHGGPHSGPPTGDDTQPDFKRLRIAGGLVILDANPETAAIDPVSWCVAAGSDAALGLANGTIEAAAEQAFATWNDEVSADPFASSASACGEGVSEITVGSLGRQAVAAAQILAGAFVTNTELRATQFRITLSTDVEWADGAEAGKYDVQSILTHEAGHPAGLDDLLSPKAFFLTMYGRASLDDTSKRTLGCGDELGIRAVYGDGVGDPAHCA